MWESPINISTITEEIGRKVTEAQEEYIYGQVRAVVDVDKDELMKALKYDRGQYERGYLDGRTDEQDRHRWTPVSERLPEEDTDVLITYHYQDGEGDINHMSVEITSYGDAYFGGRKCSFKEWRAPFPYFHSNYEVTAWMPLPEPFKMYEVSE